MGATIEIPSMSSSLPEGAAHAPLKIEARGSKPALRGFVPIRLWSTFPFFDAVVVGVTHDPHEVGGAQIHFVFGTRLPTDINLARYFFYLSLPSLR